MTPARCKPIFDLGSGPHNTVRWSPQGRFFAIAGFGNLPGDLVFYEKKADGKCKQIAATRWGLEGGGGRYSLEIMELRLWPSSGDGPPGPLAGRLIGNWTEKSGRHLEVAVPLKEYVLLCSHLLALGHRMGPYLAEPYITGLAPHSSHEHVFRRRTSVKALH